MKQRIITALILAPLVILGIFYLPLPVFMLAFAAITLMGFWEWTQFIDRHSRIPAFIPASLIICVVMGYLIWSPLFIHVIDFPQITILAVACGWWLIASGFAITYPKTRPLWEHSKFLSHLFGWLTLLPFFFSVVFLRAEHFSENVFHGARLVLYVCLIVWSADSGAYFTGRWIGQRKMAPAVSPNKTIEGLLGGIVAAFAVGLVCANLFGIHFTSTVSMFVTIFFTVVISVLGDLVESMFKRVSGIKDSSSIIPGHGGILDRIDSLTAAFPVFALLYFTI